MNTQNVNVKTAAQEPSERWGDKIISELNALQQQASQALFKFQRSADRNALRSSTSELMQALTTLVQGVPALPHIQEKVNALAEMLHVMDQFSTDSGVTGGDERTGGGVFSGGCRA